MSFTLDTASTEDVLAAILSAALPPLPAQEQPVGASTVSWWETDPGEVYIHAEGGTADDRHYGTTLVGLQLAPHGYRRAQFDMDDQRGTNVYQGSDDPAWNWDKARQIQEYGMQFQSRGDAVPGGYNGTYAGYHPETGEYMGHIDYNSADRDAVIADLQVHPDYQRQGVATKLFDYAQRYDPEMTWSHGMTTPEGEAWRQSLGSAHTAAWPDIMAKAQRLMQSGQVQMLRNGYNNMMAHVTGDHGEYDTEISRDDPDSRAITGWQCSCPWDQYAWQRTRKWKKFEGRMCAHALALYWTALGTPIDEEMNQDQAEGMGTGQAIGDEMGGMPPEGAKTEGPAPGSHEHTLPRSFSPEGEIIQGDQPPLPNMPPEAVAGPPGPAQAPMAPPPGAGAPGAPPEGPGGPTPPGIMPPFPGAPPEVAPWAGPGTTPGGQESPPGAYSVPGAKPPNQPNNPLQNPGTYSRVAADFQAPEVVKLKKDMMGIAEGPVPGQYGDGEYRDVPIGTLGEVLSQDASTGWVEAIFPLDDSGNHEPFHVRCFLEPGDIEKTQQANAFIQRRT